MILLQVNGTIQVELKKPMEDKTAKPYFRSSPFTLFNESQAMEATKHVFEQLLRRILDYQREGSGWVFNKVIGFQVSIHKHAPLKASSYMELPQSIKNTKTVLNIQNKDNRCFMWSILAHLHPVKHVQHPTRVSKYEPFQNELKFDGIAFPVNLQDITKFEAQNEISVNVFGYDPADWIYPLRVTKAKWKTHVDLLYIADQENNSHYCLIKNFNGLMHRYTKHQHKKFFCKHCLHAFHREDLLQEHMPDCIEINGAQKTYLPDPDENNLQFTNYHKGLKVPFVIYADFESITQPIEQVQREETKSYTDGYQLHVPCGFAYKVVCIDDRYTKDTVVYRGQDCVAKFLKALGQEKWRIWKVLNQPKPLIMTEENEIEFETGAHCHICGEQLENDKVRDHCHVSGKYRGAAHNACNLKFRIPSFIPVVMHNLKGYDSHLIMQHLGKIDAEVTCIPNNMEKYISFTVADRYIPKKKQKQDVNNAKKLDEEEVYVDNEDYVDVEADAENETNEMDTDETNEMDTDEQSTSARDRTKRVSRLLNLRFIDSLAFMNCSLENLVKNLKASGMENFQNLRKEFPHVESQELLTRKGVYPYDYMDGTDRFTETQLPEKDKFYSQLADEHITDSDYLHAQKVWTHWNMNTMGEYHDLYLRTDVLLLADIFENFRGTCLKNYSLDPCHYLTAPGLSWDACLRKSGITLELLSDPDMHLMIEKGIRGGISTITHRHAKANNKYLHDYDPAKESSYIVYLDANNLYGWAMSQYLPTGEFRWLAKEEAAGLDVTSIPDDGEKGYILEVDLDYPEELHDLHNEYPLAPEKTCVSEDMLSDYCKSLKDKFNIGNSAVPKLIPNLHHKSKYVIHHRNLKLYLSLGMRITKVHRCIQFNQAPWMKSYIDFNTARRKEARNAFEKDFFKLMNNSVFGKTIENIRKRVDVKLVNDERKRTKLTSQPTFKKMTIFTEDFAGIEMNKKTITLKKPIYCGMTILDNSKVLMYDFHYNFIKERYGSNARLLFTDTDSLCYEIKTDDVYAELYQDKELFDFSDYPTDCAFHDSTNKKVIGKMKDETAFVPITEFVGLRSKMYSFKTEKYESKRAKGVKKGTVEKKITHADYLRTLEDQTRSFAEMRTIRSEKHQVKSYTINKIGLSCYDDKRFILDDGKTTLAFGNKKATKQPQSIEKLLLSVHMHRKRKRTADQDGSVEEPSAKRLTV